MAKVDKLRGETIERLRGLVDFYLWKGKIPVARKWPRKPKPPYTALQAEAQAVFAIAANAENKITLHMLQAWKVNTEGERQQWTDTFKGIIMHYWKVHGVIARVATDYKVTETDTEYDVEWWVFQDYVDENRPEINYTLQSTIITKERLASAVLPVYFTLLDENGERQCAPYIKLM